MQKILPHLWFDKEAQEAATLYASLFPNSKVNGSTVIHDTPSGDAGITTMELAGQEFMLLNAGPYFKFNSSISFSVGCNSKKEVDEIWKKLSPGSKVMMELGEYPFSAWFGWLEDKFGLSWQIMFTDAKITQKITPSLLFVGKNAGRTEEAVKMYTSIFHDSKIDHLMKYGPNEGPDKPESIKHAGFTLEGLEFAAMDSALPHEFQFNEAISFVVKCKTQEEIDYYWEKLSADPAAEQCGWLKDKFGVSWQIVPTLMDDMFAEGDQAKIGRVTQAFLKMKKFDIEKLKQAADGM